MTILLACRMAPAVLTIAAGVLLTACGGGSSPADTTPVERINGVAVPPAPDPAANAATVAGVDANGNGLRDDIDRVIATEFGADMATHAKAVRFSTTEQAALVSPSAATKQAHLAALGCIRDPALLGRLSAVTRAALDTRARARAYATTFAGATLSSKECA